MATPTQSTRADYAGGMPLPPLVEPVAALRDDEASRVARHRTLAGLGDDGQRRIAAATIGVVGAGGLGSPVIMALAAAGVGELVVFDDDDVELSNLGRQVIHRKRDIGAPKTASASRVAAELSQTRVREVRDRLTMQGADIALAGLDLVIDGTDSFESREIVAAACERIGLPLVWGTVQEFFGQVTVFWSAPPDGVEPVGLHDLYPEGSQAPSCSLVGVFSPLCLQVGALMAAEAIKLVSGVGRPLIGRVALLDALAGSQREVPLRRSRRRDDAVSAGPAVHADEVDDLGGRTVLDVREPWELRGGGGASAVIERAVQLPLAETLTNAQAVVTRFGLEGEQVVVVCQVGARARMAAEALRAVGVDAAVLRGGVDGWIARRRDSGVEA